jgi:hypothetical protein
MTGPNNKTFTSIVHPAYQYNPNTLSLGVAIGFYERERYQSRRKRIWRRYMNG